MDGSAGAAGSGPTVTIRPSCGWLPLDLPELWAHRELLYFLVWRDVKVRYKQTLLGVAWVVIQPLVAAAIFAFIFGRVAGLPSEGVPYLAFVFAGLVLWQQFGGALTRISLSLVSSANLLTKVYFPRLIVPLAAAISGVVDLLVSLLLLGGMMAWYGLRPSWHVLVLPLFVLLALIAAVAFGLWLSALNVQFRDVQQVVPFLVQVWMFASPVAYAGGLIPPGRLTVLFKLNPMTGILEGFRWAIFGTPPPGELFLGALGITLLALLGGLLYFRRVEDTFADVV